MKKIAIVLLSMLLFMTSSYAKDRNKDNLEIKKSKIVQSKAVETKTLGSKSEKVVESSSSNIDKRSAITDDITKISTDLESLEMTSPAPLSTANENQINSYLFGGGSSVDTSNSYILMCSIGQPIIGMRTSSSFIVKPGFWEAYSNIGCCVGRAGDINNDGGEIADISDLIYLIDYMFPKPGSAPITTCHGEIDINGDGELLPDISDLLHLVDFMFLPPGDALEPAVCL